MATIGVLTAGGDCPGLNAVIRAVTVRILAAGGTPIGVRNGWRGLMHGEAEPLTRNHVRGIIARGGTILGTSRLDPYVHGDGLASLQPTLDATGIDGLIVIGGDGSLRTASSLAAEGLRVVGVPKTIDNDIGGTDMTFGYDTAVHIVTDAIDRITTTAEAHNRIMVIEVMGRTAGWIAIAAGMAGGAEAILIPEVPLDLDGVAERITHRHVNGPDYSIVVVAEGVAIEPSASLPEGITLKTDAYGFPRLGGVGNVIGTRLEELTGFETRVTVLGHLQRGGTPTAYDRVLGTRLGVAAAEYALEGRTDVMAALRGQEIHAVDLAAACANPRVVPRYRWDEASWFLA
jgi:ATP-dependent phosphofructokinase / diphosphate-dependent phosphofructokinase